MAYQSNFGQGWFNQTSATSNSLYYPTSIAGYPSLPSVVAPHTEYALDRDAKLAPVEWLRRQIDDVCALAVT